MQDNSGISQMLSILLIVMVVVLFALIIVYVVLALKNRAKEQIKQEKNDLNIKPKHVEDKKQLKSTKAKPAYNKRSIFDFMEFDNVQDNMIIQKNGRRFLAVVECLGVNYDLMSKMEKNAVEEGFQQFLNTLRHPIQIYIQTRTMNLEQSIGTYKEKVSLIEENYNKTLREYRRMQETGAYSQEDLNKENFEVVRNRNLLEYGKDIISNIEKMSLNKNVLTKKYYIVIPHFPEDVDKYSQEEIRNMAFAELYTKAQSIISTLSACSVSGKMLNSNELVDLLYMAYNRDEADIYGLDKALKAEYDNLYSVAPDVYQQRIKILDEEIRKQAIDIANRKIDEAKSKIRQKAEEKEASVGELARKMAAIVLRNNERYVGKEVAEEAIKSLEGGEDNVQEKKSTRRRKSN